MSLLCKDKNNLYEEEQGMKKRLLGVLLAVMLVASLGIIGASADVSTSGVDRTAGYDSAVLPEGPDMSGDVINVTPANAQYTLDGAYGNINGKTINFTAGNYTDVLVLARPTKYEGSGTVYYNMSWSQTTGWVGDENPTDFSNLTSNIRTYTRTVENVTFTSDDGVVLTGFTSTSGHIHSNVSPHYDYVIDTKINGTGNSYYGASSLVDVTFEGLAISGGISIDNYYPDETAVNSGITISNCTFTGDETQMATNGFNAIRFKADSRYFENITVTGCAITNYYQGIYVQGVDGWTVSNNTFENTTHNAIAIQSSTSNPVNGAVVIEENIIRGAGDRAIRFGEVSGNLESVTIENNVMLNSGDTDGELFKAGTLTGESAGLFSLEHNYWDGRESSKAVGNSEIVPESTGIIGGTFPENVSDYVDAGYTVVRNPDGSFSVVEPPEPVIPTPHEITIANTANGTVDTSLSNASAGAVITITATPNSGYGVSGVVVTGPDGAVTVTRVDANTYTFVMPDGPVTVSVTFGNGLPFTDVTAGQWFYDYVEYVYVNGLMNGTSATTFEPNANMTRAMVWAILARVDGETVTGESWQTAARTWAMSNGVSDGSDPNGLVTREQFATMLWRYADEPASSYSLSAFTDANSVSDWAETAMAWAVEHEIITGMTDTTLVPQGSATRAQCAAMLMRFVEL